MRIVPCLLVLLGLLASPALAQQRKTIPVLGLAAGGAVGGKGRFGPDVSLLFGKCQDACAGIGPTVGLVNPATGEYFAGIAAGAAYLGSAWWDVAARFQGSKVSGFHTSFGMGFGLMGYGALGFNTLTKKPFGELGATVKWPFL